MDTKILALTALSIFLSTNVLAGVNKFTVSKFETPNGSTTKVLSNTNKNALKLVLHIPLRAENLSKLRWDYIDFDNRTIVSLK